MSPIILGPTLFSRPSSLLPDVLVRNRGFEVDPRNTQDQVALFLRPAMRELFAMDEPRGIFVPPSGFNGAFFVFTGEELYNVVRTGVDSFEDTLLQSGLATDEPPSMDFRYEDLFFTDGEILYLTDGVAAPTVVATPDDRVFSQVKFFSNYVMFRQKNSQRLYWIPPDEITIDALDFAEAEGFTDISVQLEVLGDKLAIFGTDGTEIWYATGDSDAPFARVQGRLYSEGVWKGTVAKLPNSDTCVFTSPTGRVKVFGGDVISNPGIEERIRRAIKAQIESGL